MCSTKNIDSEIEASLLDPSSLGLSRFVLWSSFTCCHTLQPAAAAVCLWHCSSVTHGISIVTDIPLLSNATATTSCLSVMLVYCGQIVGWIKMPLGREVGLDPGDIVLDGDPSPTERGISSPPHFSTHVYRGQTVTHLSNY